MIRERISKFYLKSTIFIYSGIRTRDIQWFIEINETKWRWDKYLKTFIAKWEEQQKTKRNNDLFIEKISSSGNASFSCLSLLYQFTFGRFSHLFRILSKSCDNVGNEINIEYDVSQHQFNDFDVNRGTQ